MRRPLVLIMPLLFAAAAQAAPLDDAKRALDEGSPLQCELLTMQYKLNNGTTDRNAASDMLYKRAMEIEQVQEPVRQRYEAAMRAMTPADRQEVSRYAANLMNQCMAKSPEVFRNGALPLQVGPNAQQSPQAVPYSPPAPPGASAPASPPDPATR